MRVLVAEALPSVAEALPSGCGGSARFFAKTKSTPCLRPKTGVQQQPLKSVMCPQSPTKLKYSQKEWPDYIVL